MSVPPVRALKPGCERNAIAQTVATTTTTYIQPLSNSRHNVGKKSVIRVDVFNPILQAFVVFYVAFSTLTIKLRSLGFQYNAKGVARIRRHGRLNQC